MSTSLAQRQAALVAALVAGTAVPEGFDTHRVLAARAALLRNRADQAARAWPLTATAYGGQWTAVFSAWAAGHPPAGALRDGWDFTRAVRASNPHALPPPARRELADREARYSYDGHSTPRPRRLAALRALTRRLRTRNPGSPHPRII